MKRTLAVVVFLGTLVLSFGCKAAPTQQVDERLERDLVEAQAAYERNPTDEMASVWLGRRLGYVGRYEEAIDAFTRGLQVHPDSAWLLRFRGHRLITLHRFDAAVSDLERARELAALRPDEVEPDGAPNPKGIPRGTLRSNIDYHLGLAQYLSGHFDDAWRSYDRGFALARTNDDRLVSHTYWSWIVLRKLGREAEAASLLAPIREHMDLLENFGYHALLRLYRGDITEADVLNPPATSAASPKKNDFATRGFGAGMKRLFDGDRAGAKELFERVVATGPKSAFGCIAAEVELARLAH